MLVLVLGLALTVPMAIQSHRSASVTDAETATVASATPALPFDLPSTSALRSTGKLVFAHYWPPMVVSLDNENPSTDYYARNYLTPTGEKGKHKAYGGLLRDRPIPRAAMNGATETQWRLADLQTEVRQAIAAGIDGFTLNIMQLPGDPDYRQVTTLRTMMKAAASVDPGFKIMPEIDMSGSLVNKSAAQLASFIAELGASKSAFHLPDGRLVVSSFKAEAKTPAFWTSFMNTMQSAHNMKVAFVPVFVATEQTWAPKFKSISYGMGNWGSRNPKWNDPTGTYPTSPISRAKAVRAMGMKWMQPVSVQDSRPNTGIYDEAENTTNLRNTWQIARSSASDWVQIPTWNDYTENAEIAPSVKHGWSLLDINAYYLDWFKTGTAPKIVRDTVYLTHRTQTYSAKPSYAQTKLMSWRGGSPARNTVEALSFLTAPATVKVNVGGVVTTCNAPAGVSSCIAPLRTGTVSVAVNRGSTAVASVTSPNKVVATPYVQNLAYVAASSRREGTSSNAAAPAVSEPAPAPAATPATSTVSLAPTADSYANEGAPAKNYGTTSTLEARGDVGAVSYLRFAVPQPPSGKTLKSAVLRFHTADVGTAGSTEQHPVRLASDSWSETGVTWNNRPAVTTTTLGTVAANTAPGSVVRTTLDPAGLASRAGSNATLAVVGSGTNSLWFWSRSRLGPDYQPALVLTYG
jgi:hypothetical protein